MMCSKPFSRHGFSLVELVVSASIITILISLLLPALARAKDLALRVRCAGNVAGIVKAELIYAGDYNNVMSVGNFSGCIHSTLNVTAGIGRLELLHMRDVSYEESIGISNRIEGHSAISIQLFRLVLMERANPRLFNCPADPYSTGPSIRFYPPRNSWIWDFAYKSNVSYGANHMWTYPEGDDGWLLRSSDKPRPYRVAPWWKTTFRYTVPLISDSGPVTGIDGQNVHSPQRDGVMEEANSLNHDRKGQQVGFNDGHVEWHPNPYVDRIGGLPDNLYVMHCENNNAHYPDFSFIRHLAGGFGVFLPTQNEPYDFIMTMPNSSVKSAYR